MLSFFLWNVSFFYFHWFLFWFAQWNNFIGYFNFNQISSYFCSFLKYSFRSKHSFSISSTLLIWSVNQNSTKENSVLILFIIFKENSEILINYPNCLFGAKANKTFEVCWLSFFTRLQCTKKNSTDSNFRTFSPSLSL